MLGGVGILSWAFRAARRDASRRSTWRSRSFLLARRRRGPVLALDPRRGCGVLGGAPRQPRRTSSTRSSTSAAGRSTIFRGALRFVFTFVIPLALMTTYPAEAILGDSRSRPQGWQCWEPCRLLWPGVSFSPEPSADTPRHRASWTRRDVELVEFVPSIARAALARELKSERALEASKD